MVSLQPAAVRCSLFLAPRMHLLSQPFWWHTHTWSLAWTTLNPLPSYAACSVHLGLLCPEPLQGRVARAAHSEYCWLAAAHGISLPRCYGCRNVGVEWSQRYQQICAQLRRKGWCRPLALCSTLLK